MKKWFLFPLLLLLVAGFILTGCGGGSSPTTTAAPPTTAAPTTAAPTTAAPTSAIPTSPAADTAWNGKFDDEFVFGLNTDLTGSLGNQVMNIGDIVVGMFNAKGGIVVGGKHYQIKCITYSNDNDVNKGIAAVNRAVFQDKVKFIVSHGVQADYACPITQPAGVMTYSMSTVWNTGFLDKYTLNFSMLGQATHEVAVAGYLIDTYPEIRQPGTGLAFAMPDNAMGHQMAANVSTPYISGCAAHVCLLPG